MNQPTQHHPSTCKACGVPVQHYGRRDLLEVVHQVERELEPRKCEPQRNLVEHLLEREQRAVESWQLLRCVLWAVEGRCPLCELAAMAAAKRQD